MGPIQVPELLCSFKGKTGENTLATDLAQIETVSPEA